MIPHDKLTIVRNRVRARELRVFRRLVESYFERAEYGTDEYPVDWAGARDARARINRMLPRVIQVVRAARLDAPDEEGVGPALPAVNVRLLHNIFGARYTESGDQEVLDVIDMAMGVYDSDLLSALGRTVNPLHYLGRALGFVVGLPRRGLKALGFLSGPRAPRLAPRDIARLEAVAAKLSDADELIDMRLAEVRERLAEQYAEDASHVAELAERLDFMERVLAQGKSPPLIRSPDDSNA